MTQPLVTVGIIVVCIAWAISLVDQWLADSRRHAEEVAQIEAFIAEQDAKWDAIFKPGRRITS